MGFSNLALTPFQCFEHPNGKKSIYSFPNVLCYEDDHGRFIAMACFMCCTVMLPFNVIFLMAIYRLQSAKRDAAKSIVLLKQFKLFFARWRPDRAFWGYIFTLRQ